MELIEIIFYSLGFILFVHQFIGVTINLIKGNDIW